MTSINKLSDIVNNGLCIGCGRTVDEISNWLYYSDKQKKNVIKDLKNRNHIDS